MARYDLNEFLQKSAQQDRGQGLFELERDRILEVNLDGEVWTKTGSMIAYIGGVKFVREGVLQQGVGNLLKKVVTGEGTKLTKAVGRGKVYLADSGKKITILNLQNEAIFINANDVLAFEMSLKYDIKMLQKMAAMMSGGLFNARFQGPACSRLLRTTIH